MTDSEATKPSTRVIEYHVDESTTRGTGFAASDEKTTTFRCVVTGPDADRTVKLTSDWRREGMAVVVDSMTGNLLGCIGLQEWGRLVATELNRRDNEEYVANTEGLPDNV